MQDGGERGRKRKRSFGDEGRVEVGAARPGGGQFEWSAIGLIIV